MATFYHFNLTSLDQDHFIFYCSNKKVMKTLVLQHSLKKRIFVLRKFVKTVEKIMFLFVLVCFCHGNIIFSELASNENVRKQHLSVNAYFCVNMKFSYMIAGRNDEISYCNENKQFFAGI